MNTNKLILYCRNLISLSLLKLLFITALILTLFSTIKSLNQGSPPTFSVIKISLWYGISEAIPFLAAIALFHYYNRLHEKKESLLTQLFTNNFKFQLRVLWPILIILGSYSLAYQAVLKPNFKLEILNNPSPSSWGSHKIQEHDTRKVKHGTLWTTKDKTNLQAIYHHTGNGLNSWISAKESNIENNILKLENGIWEDKKNTLGIDILFNTLIFNLNKSLREKEKTLLTLSQENNFIHRIQLRLSHSFAIIFLLIYTFIIAYQYIESKKNRTAIFLFGILLIYLPLQLIFRKMTFDSHGMLTYLNWSAPLTLIAYAFLIKKVQSGWKA